MINIIWIGLIWLLFLWDAVIIGIVPIILTWRFRTLFGTRPTILSRIEIVRFIFFDIGIVTVTLWLLKIQVSYIQLHQYGFHDWWSMFLAQVFLICFAVGLILSTTSLRRQSSAERWR